MVVAADALRGRNRPTQVDDFESRIGGRLQIDDLASLCDRGVQPSMVSGIDEVDVDTHFRQEFKKELRGASIGIRHGYHPITGSQQSK